MSGSGPQLAPRPVTGTLPKGRSPLAHLLHALNQPLTGLQCSLELAMAGPRRPEEYVRTLREGLSLTERMRILVAAMRELADTQPSDSEIFEEFQFDTLLRDTAQDLLPVAESKNVHLSLLSHAPLLLRADRRFLSTLIFRLLESALSLTRTGSDLQILVNQERETICLEVSWNQGHSPEHSPFSRQELGLLIAQSGFERAGAEWTCAQEDTRHTCTVRMPRVSPLDPRKPCHPGDLK
jgi:hypothetical protein